MKKLFGILLLFPLCLLLSACNQVQTVQGNGIVRSETRTVDPFTEVHLDGHYRLKLVPGQTRQVVIRADANVIPYIISAADGKVLNIGTQRDIRIDTRTPPVITVTVPSLTGIEVAGSAQVEANQIQADALTIKIDGSGTFTLGGKVKKLQVHIAGNGYVQALPLIAQDVEVKINGDGRVWVTAEKKLMVKISGSGYVEYHGSPEKVTQSIAGTGEVVGAPENQPKNKPIQAVGRAQNPVKKVSAAQPAAGMGQSQ